MAGWLDEDVERLGVLDLLGAEVDELRWVVGGTGVVEGADGVGVGVGVGDVAGMSALVAAEVVGPAAAADCGLPLEAQPASAVTTPPTARAAMALRNGRLLV